MRVVGEWREECRGQKFICQDEEQGWSIWGRVSSRWRGERENIYESEGHRGDVYNEFGGVSGEVKIMYWSDEGWIWKEVHGEEGVIGTDKMEWCKWS